MIDIEQVLTELLDREGRTYTNDPADRGGPTKFGITQARLAVWRQRAVLPEDVEELTESEARAIYRAQYLTDPGIYKIADPYLLVLVFDCAVLHGPGRAVRWLQQALGTVDDGVFGTVTETLANGTDAVRTYQRVLARRVRFFGEIIADDPERRRATAAGYRLQAKFAKGWLRRAADFIET